MARVFRFTIVIVAFLALSWSYPRAQGTTGQKPPDAAAKPDPQARPAAPAPIPPEEYPPDYKAFNEVAKETNASKRVELYEKFIADNPKSDLLPMARTQMQSTLLAVMKDAQKKYLDIVGSQVDTAKKAGNTPTSYSTFNRFASELLNGGVLLEQAEEYSRTGLSMMDEQKYIDARRQASQRSADAFAQRAASPAPATATTAAPEFFPSFSMKDGVATARPVRRSAPARPATPPQPPRIPTDADLRTQFRSEKASAQATLGQILMKRGKTEEAEGVLKEAYSAHPPAYTMATIARLLSDSAKKAGDDKGQLEYLTALALSGRITAAERQEFDAVYRKTHGGSLDGVEEMLDERYRRENPRFEVTPFARKTAPNGRTVLAEMFTGAG